eukprot:Awhi_evm1s852
MGNVNYDIDTVNFNATSTDKSAEEWIITTVGNDIHPLHIHVNPFMVMSVTSNVTFNNEENWDELTAITERSVENRWKDSILVPPNGQVTIRMRFDASLRKPGTKNTQQFIIGKTVMHCH